MPATQSPTRIGIPYRIVISVPDRPDCLYGIAPSRSSRACPTPQLLTNRTIKFLLHTSISLFLYIYIYTYIGK